MDSFFFETGSGQSVLADTCPKDLSLGRSGTIVAYPKAGPYTEVELDLVVCLVLLLLPFFFIIIFGAYFPRAPGLTTSCLHALSRGRLVWVVSWAKPRSSPWAAATPHLRFEAAPSNLHPCSGCSAKERTLRSSKPKGDGFRFVSLPPQVRRVAGLKPLVAMGWNRCIPGPLRRMRPFSGLLVQKRNPLPCIKVLRCKGPVFESDQMRLFV